MFGIDEQVGLSHVPVLGRIFDYVLSAGAMCEKQQSTHASGDVVSTVEFGTVLAGHEASPDDLEARAYRRWSTVLQRLGHEEPRD